MATSSIHISLPPRTEPTQAALFTVRTYGTGPLNSPRLARKSGQPTARIRSSANRSLLTPATLSQVRSNGCPPARPDHSCDHSGDSPEPRGKPGTTRWPPLRPRDHSTPSYEGMHHALPPRQHDHLNRPDLRSTTGSAGWFRSRLDGCDPETMTGAAVLVNPSRRRHSFPAFPPGECRACDLVAFSPRAAEDLKVVLERGIALALSRLQAERYAREQIPWLPGPRCSAARKGRHNPWPSRIAALPHWKERSRRERSERASVS
jgi:hypothetical protein